MDSDLPDVQISDVVMSTAGRDQGEWFYVIDADPVYLFLANGKDRTIETQAEKTEAHKKSFALRPELPARSFPATKCSTANYEETWRSSPGKCKANNLGG